MLIDVTAVKPLPDYKRWLQFADGASGTLGFRDIAGFSGVFKPLEDPAEFAKVTVNPELGVICWPNGADLDSDVLYATATGQPIKLDKDNAHG